MLKTDHQTKDKLTINWWERHNNLTRNMHVVIKKTVFIKKKYLKDGNCMTSNIFVLNIHQFEDTKEWLKMVLLNHQAF